MRCELVTAPDRTDTLYLPSGDAASQPWVSVKVYEAGSVNGGAEATVAAEGAEDSAPWKVGRPECEVHPPTSATRETPPRARPSRTACLHHADHETRRRFSTRRRM